VPSTVVVAAGRKAQSEFAHGRDIYNYRCYFCHGYSGDAKTLASSYLEPKPRDFTTVNKGALSREKMILAVKEGRSGTAMVAFNQQLSDRDIIAVVDFIRAEFMNGESKNTRYHTIANGWPNHQRFKVAYPFALGELSLDMPWPSMTDVQQRGWRLYMSSCITCHDRASVHEEGELWNRRSISFPRGGYSHKNTKKNKLDSVSAASAYAMHYQVPSIDGLTPSERRGEMIFQDNCAFCHGADGTGKNWIGSFLQPHPRDLSVNIYSIDHLKNVVQNGIPGTTMSAWKSVLTELQINDVSAYVKRLSEKRKSPVGLDVPLKDERHLGQTIPN